MKCSACGKDNPEDTRFCGGCGASLEAPPVTTPTPQENISEGQEETGPVEIPDDAIFVRQSNWAYLLPALPWMVLFGLSIFFDFLTFGIVPVVLASFFIGTRYQGIRRTAYILTDSHIIILQGSFLGQKRLDVSFTDLGDVLIQPGMFGRSLGYTGVGLQLKDGQMALLHYVPSTSPLFEHVRERMESNSPLEEEPDGDI